MVRKRRRTTVTAAGAAGLLCVATVSGTVGASAAGAATSGRTILAGTLVPAAARQHPAGGVSRSARVDFDLVLKLRDAAGAQALVKAVSTPGSASYRHYLTTAQWESRFSPAAGAVSRARTWLTSEGFKVGAVSKDRITISASGTAAQVERAFGTGLANYKLDGRTVRLATREMSVPTSIAGTVLGAMGINENVATPDSAAGSTATAQTGAASKAINFPPAPAAFITARPCGSYYNQKITTVKPPFGQGYPKRAPYNVCGYKPRLSSARPTTSARPPPGRASRSPSSTPTARRPSRATRPGTSR